MEGRCTWRKGKDMLINCPNIQDAVLLSYELLALKITFSTTPNSSTVMACLGNFLQSRPSSW